MSTERDQISLSLANTPAKRPGQSSRSQRDLTQDAAGRIVGFVGSGPNIDPAGGGHAGSRSQTVQDHGVGKNGHLKENLTRSASASLVPVVQPANLRDGHDLAMLEALYFPSRRRIRSAKRAGFWHFETRVASSATVAERGRAQVALDSLQRNRVVSVVSFDLDERGRIVARIVHPAETLQPDEAWLLLLTLAREADRWEQQLTGRDYY